MQKYNGGGSGYIALGLAFVTQLLSERVLHEWIPLKNSPRVAFLIIARRRLQCLELMTHDEYVPFEFLKLKKRRYIMGKG